MKRPKHTTPNATPRLRWMAPVSPGESSPMDRLMAWLERNGEEYRMSKRKLDMLEQLGEEMATSGIYGLTISSIRSQLSRLKHGVQMKAEGGKCTSMDVNHYYDRLLALLFDEGERAEMREHAAERAAQYEDEKSAPLEHRERRRTRSRSTAPREAVKTESGDSDGSDTQKRDSEERQLPNVNLQAIDPVLDTIEIRRRFELLSARQGLQQQGVDQETIDSFLPLSRT